jgi:hypothetical protein
MSKDLKSGTANKVKKNQDDLAKNLRNNLLRRKKTKLEKNVSKKV